jgi:hypothetical protein
VTPGFPLLGFSNSPISPYPTDSSDSEALRRPFGELLNLFHWDQVSANSPQLARLLDYVEVPSPYLSAERWFNATNYPTPASTSPLTTYSPPFYKVSRFRDPGKININTIFDEQVWIAATGQFPSMISGAQMNTASFAQNVFLSRQGNTGASWLAFNPSYPTLFANPFRAADAADLMPNVPSAGNSMRQLKGVDVTLLRPHPSDATQALLDRNDSTNVWQNTRRNPYFRYQGLQKLGSVFTTHSNCFAVWITVGYFEVEASSTGVDAAHPDGFQLAQEIGYDSGEVTRHRAFFIIDRSVPVGFMPGQKLNTDNAVLLRRFIE